MYARVALILWVYRQPYCMRATHSGMGDPEFTDSTERPSDRAVREASFTDELSSATGVASGGGTNTDQFSYAERRRVDGFSFRFTNGSVPADGGDAVEVVVTAIGPDPEKAVQQVGINPDGATFVPLARPLLAADASDRSEPSLQVDVTNNDSTNAIDYSLFVNLSQP